MKGENEKWPRMQGHFSELTGYLPAPLRAARFASQSSNLCGRVQALLPDHVFSVARLRGYRVLEAAGLGDAVSL
jgi:hypothetical protein